MRKISLTPQDIDLIARVVETEVPASIGRQDPQEYARMVHAVVDTITNRMATDGFPDTATGVMNQRRAFSKITGPSRLDPYGSVQEAPSASQNVMSLVSSHLASRANGAPSVVGNSLHYANPNFSDRSNLQSWVTPMIDSGAQRLGVGQSVHYHGNAPGYDGAPEYSLAIDGLEDDGRASPSAPFRGASGDTSSRPGGGVASAAASGGVELAPAYGNATGNAFIEAGNILGKGLKSTRRARGMPAVASIPDPIPSPEWLTPSSDSLVPYVSPYSESLPNESFAPAEPNPPQTGDTYLGRDGALEASGFGFVAARDDVSLNFDEGFADVLRRAAGQIGSDTSITSGYRSQSHQDRIRFSGNPNRPTVAKHSYHTGRNGSGSLAADVARPSSMEELVRLVDAHVGAGATGVGIYDGHVHFDMRSSVPSSFNPKSNWGGWTSIPPEVMRVLVARGYRPGASASSIRRGFPN